MTDRFAALTVLVHRFGDTREAKDALASFEQQFGKDGLVMDKWFNVQASRPGEVALQAVRGLTKHALFSLDNPNRVRSLIGSFSASNPTGFNRKDGAAYEFCRHDPVHRPGEPTTGGAASDCAPFLALARRYPP